MFFLLTIISSAISATPKNESEQQDEAGVYERKNEQINTDKQDPLKTAENNENKPIFTKNPNIDTAILEIPSQTSPETVITILPNPVEKIAPSSSFNNEGKQIKINPQPKPPANSNVPAEKLA